MSSESSCPGGATNLRGRLVAGFSSITQGGAGSVGRKEALSPCVAPCPGTLSGSAAAASPCCQTGQGQLGCRTPAMVGAHCSHSGLRWWEWALQGISVRPMVMPFAEPPGRCRVQVPSEHRSCCHGNRFLHPKICFASSLLLLKPTPDSQAASSLGFVWFLPVYLVAFCPLMPICTCLFFSCPLPWSTAWAFTFCRGRYSPAWVKPAGGAATGKPKPFADPL